MFCLPSQHFWGPVKCLVLPGGVIPTEEVVKSLFSEAIHNTVYRCSQIEESTQGYGSIREHRIGSVCGGVGLVLLGRTLWNKSCLDFRIYFLIGRNKIYRVRIFLGEPALSLPMIVQTCKIFVRLDRLILQKPGYNTLCVQPRNCLKNCSQLPIQVVRHIPFKYRMDCSCDTKPH